MILYGLLSAAAVCMTAGAPRDERLPAFSAGLVILAGWGLFVLSWTDYAPALITGLDPIDIWAFTDLMSAAAILYIARGRWWSSALWGLFCAQTILHCAHSYAGMLFAPYSTALDVLFLGQIAVLFLVGGAGCVDRLFDWYDNARDVRRPPWAAEKETP